MALCVSLCPTEELKTYQDLKKFAMVNGEGINVTRLLAHLNRCLDIQIYFYTSELRDKEALF